MTTFPLSKTWDVLYLYGCAFTCVMLNGAPSTVSMTVLMLHPKHPPETPMDAAVDARLAPTEAQKPVISCKQ